MRSPRPIPIMLERTNVIMAIEMAVCFRSMVSTSRRGAPQNVTVPDI
jgi:hypothetical protein